jgi:hypothetical protein
MCSPNHPQSNAPRWGSSGWSSTRKNRGALIAAAVPLVLLAAVAGLFLHRHGSTDLERAEADIEKARRIVRALEAESDEQVVAAETHKKKAAEYRRAVAENQDTSDATWLEWQEAMAARHARLREAKNTRRDTVLHLAAEYRRLLTEAECELLRAKDARDRGTPYKVAPRIRAILTPVLGTE